MTAQEIQDQLLDLLHEERNKHPNHLSKNMYAGQFLDKGISDEDLHNAIYNLHRKGTIIFKDGVYKPHPFLRYPLAYSTFHLPN